MTRRERLIKMAGFFDGEGSISLTKHWRRKYQQIHLNIRVSNTFPELLKWFLVYFGGRLNRRAPSHLGKRSLYTWACPHSNRENFLKKVGSFLESRPERVEVAKQFLKTGSREVRPKGYPPKLKKEREELYRRMKVLNGNRKGGKHNA